MFIVFKFAYQLWHTMDKSEVAAEVANNSITPDDYKTITSEDYVAPAKVDGGDQGETQK
ncbi:XkdX family protein [Lactiplantibacillus plantarum]|uniref:XkdX family protein n=1 Tax=Lactiplantibacillus plantarum TaxID=1590 RepID=UPI001CFE5AAC|nr:XkdX family protein [Lactiplantibacillus plantarum]GJI52559.1 XkdX family protein [Lactiplantibacillus plantarum]